MTTPDTEWVDFKAARRMMQAEHGWRPTDDEAGRWVVDRTARGKIRYHPDDVWVAEDLAEHLAGEPDMHHRMHVHLARYAAADISSVLKAEKLGRPPKKRGKGREEEWDWKQGIAELQARFSLDLPKKVLASALQQIITDREGTGPGISSCQKRVSKLIANRPAS